MSTYGDTFYYERKAGSCTCEECVLACHNMPGWFAPGEAEQAAEMLGMSFSDFFQCYLVVDSWEESGDMPDNTYVLRPRTIEEDGGEAVLSWSTRRGRCIFLTEEDRCQIHEKKPDECRTSYPCERQMTPVVSEREQVASKWRDSHSQDFVKKLFK